MRNWFRELPIEVGYYWIYLKLNNENILNVLYVEYFFRKIVYSINGEIISKKELENYWFLKLDTPDFPE